MDFHGIHKNESLARRFLRAFAAVSIKAFANAKAFDTKKTDHHQLEVSRNGNWIAKGALAEN